MNQNERIKGMLNIAKKAREIVFGLELIQKEKRKIFLIITSVSASERLKKEGVFNANKQGCQIIHDFNIAEALKTKNCGIVAITSQGIAEKIIKIRGEI